LVAIMLDIWNAIAFGPFDLLLGWLLALSWTATLVAVALLTGLALAAVRKVTSDQDLLRRASADKARLKQLLSEARAKGDKAAVERIKRTRAMVALRASGQEWKPLLVVILPIALLATWCYARLEFHPPRDGEAVTVELVAPASAAGESAHIVPVDGVRAASGWIAAAREETRESRPVAVARWVLTGRAAKTPYPLALVLRGKTYAHELRVGGRVYSPPLAWFDDGEVTLDLRMRQARLFGLVPGIGAMFPPWLVAYLILVVPLALGLKRVLRIY
jgi:uncharacterized membrane protein (DUF106 family)